MALPRLGEVKIHKRAGKSYGWVAAGVPDAFAAQRHFRASRKHRMTVASSLHASRPPLPLWPQPKAQGEGLGGHFDYCLLPYTPGDPTAEDIASANVLRWSWEAHGVLAEGEALVRRLLAGLGTHQVVWGIKHRAGQPNAPSWELYFYRRPHNPPSYTLARVAELFAPLVVQGELPSHWHWLMFSVEFDVGQLRGQRPCESSVYLESSGLSYKLRANQPPELENHYIFRDPQAGIDDILARLQVSVHARQHPQSLAHLLPPQLMRAFHVCVANKRTADAVYWSRVDLAQLQFFLKRHGWPQRLREQITAHAPRLQHLRWDLGADFQREPQDETGVGFSFIKSGIYGSF